MSELNVFWRETIHNKNNRLHEKENNVTSAFLITISKNKSVAEKLIKKLTNFKTTKNTEYIFQVPLKKSNITKEKKQQALLFIKSKYNNTELKDLTETSNKRSIPDGLILDKNFAIIIESKVNATKSNEQLERYKKHFLKSNNILEIETSWQEIYEELKKINNNDFLVNQFLRYLELIEMSGFRGLKFFKTGTIADENTEYSEKEACEISKELCEELKEFLDKKNMRIGDRPKTAPWDFFYSKELGEKIYPQAVPHMSFSFTPQEFDINIMFKHKKILNKIIQNPKEFLDLIKQNANDENSYFVATEYRMLKLKSGKGIAQTGAKYTTFKLELQLNRKKFEEQKLLSALQFASNYQWKEVSIRKKFYYQDKYDQKINKLNESEYSLKKIKQTIEELYPIYQYILKLNKK